MLVPLAWHCDGAEGGSVGWVEAETVVARHPATIASSGRSTPPLAAQHHPVLLAKSKHRAVDTIIQRQ